MKSIFSRKRLVRFSDCDPAGIVFYPQYFVMFNGLIEDWFNEGLGVSYSELVAERRVGLPTVRLEVDFKSVSRMGDTVSLTLDVERLGGRSLALKLQCLADDGQVRMRMRQVLVVTSLATHAAIDMPSDMREAVSRAAAIVQ